MNVPEAIDKLVYRYAMGEVTRAEMDALEAWLREDPEHVRWFASYGLVEQGLLTVGRESTATDLMDALSALEDPGEPAELVDLTDELRQRGLDERRREQRRRMRLRPFGDGPASRKLQPAVWIGLAALLGLAAWLGWPKDKPDTANDTPRTAHQDRGDTRERGADQQPIFVATVRASVDAHWTGAVPEHATVLPRNAPVTLTQGLAEVVFDDGAAVIIQAPATLVPTGPNGMRLITGRIAATVPDRAHGFTVDTPGGLITDYGTEFGVVVNPDGQTLAQTYTGRVGLRPAGGGAEVDLPAGRAARADTRGRVRDVPVEEHALVRADEFAAIQRADDSPRDRWVARRYALQRDETVLAFIPFVRPDRGWPGAIGLRAMRASDGFQPEPDWPIGNDAYATPIPLHGDNGTGDALVGNGVDAYYLDLDTAPGGRFERAGLLDTDGRIGRPGTTVYLLWRMQADGSGTDPEDFAGLSLMTGNRNALDEPLFIGCASTSAGWSIQARHRGQVNNDRGIRPLVVDGRDAPLDTAAHLWLVRIDFNDGPDRVRVYLDPDLTRDTLPEPNVTLDGYDLAFDRLRFMTGGSARAWRIDELLVSTQRPVLSPGTVPGG